MIQDRLRRRAGFLGAALLVALAVAPEAAAEPFLDLYTGKSFTQNSDVRIRQPSQQDKFTFDDVSFKDESFDLPPYYGARLGYYFEKYPWLGVGAEFFHFKIIADTTESKRLSGTNRGSPVNATVPMDSVVQTFQLTHGVNYLTADVLLRYSLLEEPERFPRGRLQLYGGAGVGPVIAHPETRIDGASNDGPYQVAGVGVQAFVGARVMLFKYVGLFTEYKFTHSSLDVSVARGTGSFEENTHHIVGGLTFTLPSF